MAAMKKHVWATIALLGAGACGTKDGDLRGKAVGTDHYQEMFGSTRRIGDLQVALDGTGDPAAISFAAPASDWTDPRPGHITGRTPPTPAAFLAQSGCVLRLTRGGDFATVDPGQSCHAEGTTLKVTQGKVWLTHHVLNVDLSGEINSGGAYTLIYPMLLDTDDALPVK
jgi:hypothetical protein